MMLITRRIGVTSPLARILSRTGLHATRPALLRLRFIPEGKLMECSMKLALLGLAAMVTVGLPPSAMAQDSSDSAFVAIPATGVHRDFRRDGFDRFDRRRLRGNSDTVIVYDRDWQGDSVWRSNSFNDWWHDRPDRSLPRWVRNNQDCQRMYWAGGGWRC
jgi:hypothetical protein